MPINAGPEFLKSEKEYLNAKSPEEKIYWLEEMIRTAPKHKGSENLLARLRARLKKFKEQAEKSRKKSSGRKGIRKEGFQFVLVGKANSGKSSLLNELTNAEPKIADYPFSTTSPEIGTFDFFGVKAQVIDMPSIRGEGFDIGIVNTADCIIEVVDNLEDLSEVEEVIKRAKGKRIVVVTKTDLLGENELRKLKERIKSKRINGVAVSVLNGFGINELKEKMFNEMGVIRVYTKEPGKEKSDRPMVLPSGATVRDVAEMILKGFSSRVKETRLTGPSGKFPNQVVGLGHKVKDLDVVEFHTM